MKIRHALLAAAAFSGCVFGTASASAQGVIFHAILNGGNEIDGAGYARAGDTNGYGAASVIFAGTGRLCFTIAVFGIGTPTAAHIHKQVAGVNGPISVTLTAPSAGNPGTSAGCVAGISATLLNQIKGSPSSFYINVHTSDKPSGSIRGQLF
jgi:hypothetical protein